MVDVSDCTGHSRKSGLARTSRTTSDSRKDAWPRVKLGEVCAFHRGLTYSKKDEVTFSSNAVLRSNNVDLETGRLKLDDQKYIRDDFEIPSEKLVVKDAILMCMANGSKAHLSKVALIDTDKRFAFGGFMGMLVPKQEVISGSYLYWVLSSQDFKQLVSSLTDGTNINNLKFSDIDTFELPLPPLAVQHEIVARLEKELAAVERMAKGFEALKAEADQLFRSTLKETFEEVSRGGAETRRLGDVCRFIDYRGMTPTKAEKGIPLITARNIRFGYMDYRERFYISKDDYLNRQSRGVAHRGDILFTTEAPMGFVAIADLEVFSTGQRIITFQWPDQVRHNNAYFLYYFMSDVFQTQLRENASGATAQGIKASRLVNLNVLIPSIPTQREIVAKLDAVRGRCEKLKRAAEEGLQTAALMRKAILKEAFA